VKLSLEMSHGDTLIHQYSGTDEVENAISTKVPKKVDIIVYKVNPYEISIRARYHLQ
jgi:hypothetical protein